MAEFLQTYGIWIFFGLLFSLMLWGHSSGHGMGIPSIDDYPDACGHSTGTKEG